MKTKFLSCTKISDTNIFFYCRGLHDQIIHDHSSNSDNYFRFLNVEFYTEFKNNFVGKEVSIIKNGGFRQDYYPSYKCYPRGLVSYQNIIFFDGNSNRDSLEFKHEFIKPGDIIIDALNNDKLKILDSVFFVKDIVLKGAEVYCILEGEKTGTFSLITTNINYATLVCSVERSNILSKPYFHAHYPVPVSSVHDDNCKSLILINIDDYNSTKNEIESRYKEDEVATRKKQIEEEKARLQKEKEYQQAIIREQSEFRQHMIAKYGAEKGSLVGNHQLAIGMTKEMVRDAWRRPMDTYRTTTKYGQSEVWCYNYKTRVYFYNGIVVQIDD